MERGHSTRICVFIVAALLAAFASAGAQAPHPSGTPATMDRAKEIELALSACPPSIASKTAVYVLEKSGYVKVRNGENSFTAIVQHATPNSQEPQCMDAEAARTFLPRIVSDF